MNALKDHAFGDRLTAYPERPNFKTTGPSEQAASRIASSVKAMHGRILDLLKTTPDGLSADEIGEALAMSPLCVRPRVSELRRSGEITATAVRRRNQSGMSATVWKLAPPPPWQPQGGSAT
jgi:hypothetical protein